MKSRKLNKIICETPDDVQEHIKFCMDVTDRIHELLNKKFDGNQKLLADKMGETETEVSKWFSGIQNFTIKTLIKLSVAFDEPVIAVCTYEDEECVSKLDKFIKFNEFVLADEEMACECIENIHEYENFTKHYKNGSIFTKNLVEGFIYGIRYQESLENNNIIRELDKLRNKIGSLSPMAWQVITDDLKRYEERETIALRNQEINNILNK